MVTSGRVLVIGSGEAFALRREAACGWSVYSRGSSRAVAREAMNTGLSRAIVRGVSALGPVLRSIREAPNWLRWSDVRVAAIAAAAQIGGSIGASSHQHTHRHFGCWWQSTCTLPQHLDVVAFVLLAAGPVALLIRRRYPRAVFLYVFAVTLLYVALGYPQGPVYVALAIAFVMAVLCGHRWLTRLAIPAGWALFLWLPPAVGTASTPTLLEALSVAAWLLVLLGVCEAMRGRRERRLEDRRRRELQARRQADEERLRIARELHDVLAHSISLINVQSGVALHLLDEHPDQARTALTAINEASADALREVRSVLGVLRGDGEQPPRTPTAGLASLDELVTRSKAAGMNVSVQVQGERRPLPTSVDLAAFRIVQESLTNAVRHGGASEVTIRLDYGPEALTVQVDDDGSGPSHDVASDGGSGIPGMRERAVALGGELVAGAGPGGGFRVRARLPAED
jgi:signal transduction histidine kinase